MDSVHDEQKAGGEKSGWILETERLYLREMGQEEVCSIIRDSNTASQNVAKRNGMALRGQFTKRYYGTDMPHLFFSVKRGERQ